MSPQMNGEPRDEASRANRVTDATSPAPHGSELPLPPSLNTDRLIKSVVKENGEFAPLFTLDAMNDFRARWDLVQRSFVDDPKEAVHAADELVAQVTQTLMETFADQRTKLEKEFDQAEAPSTESLRIALRQYRSFFERLLSI
jgi:hypothetical protein